MAAVDFHLIRAFRPAFHNPFGVKAVHHVGNVHIEHSLMGSSDLKKAVVAPDDLAGIDAQNGGGQRKIHERIF